jgi:hypothetical protein
MYAMCGIIRVCPRSNFKCSRRQNWNGHTAIVPLEGRSAVAQLTRGQVQEHMDGGHFGANYVLF